MSSIPPIPAKLDRSADRWKSPTQGYPDRDPRVVLCLQAEFDKTPELKRFEPWKFLGALADLLGDHRLDMDSHAPYSLLDATGYPWRSLPYRHSLRSILSWFGDARVWPVLDRIWADHFSFVAHRSGGAARHDVWELEAAPARSYAPASICFVLRTRHIPFGSLAAFRSLILGYFECAASAGAYYGRGDFVVPADVHSFNAFGRMDLYPFGMQESVWHNSARRSVPLVPGVHRFNLLSNAHLERLGGAVHLGNRLKEIESEWTISAMPGGGALIDRGPIGTYELQYAKRQEQEPSTPETWILGQFSKAGLLAIQHMDWVEHRLKEYIRFNREHNERLRREAYGARPPVRGLDNWLKDLRTRPPRCIRDVAVLADGMLPGRFAAEFDHSTTHFEIVPPGRGRAKGDRPRGLTVYGRAAQRGHYLGSPIRAGSPDAERAAFTFDALRDGWDGAQSEAPNPSRPRLMQLKCPRCDGRLFELRAVFQYSEELNALEEESLRHAEDFFDWFWLIARCVACSWHDVVADVECA